MTLKELRSHLVIKKSHLGREEGEKETELEYTKVNTQCDIKERERLALTEEHESQHLMIGSRFKNLNPGSRFQQQGEC